jgi:TolB-like protein
MKIGTAKSMAKNLLSTKAGKQVSDAAFKKFVKQDKDLKKLNYSSDKSTVSKFQAKKILGQVAKDAASSEKFKVSRFAQKLGLKQSGESVRVSDISLEKVYTKGAEEELKVEKPAGPSPDEQRREKRREEAVKTLHKRERADELNKERLGGPKPTPAQSGQKQAAAPLMHTGLGGAGQNAQVPPGGGMSDNVSSANTQSGDAAANLLTVLVLPLLNISGTAEDIDWLIKKINKLTVQTLTSLRLFKVVGQTSSTANPELSAIDPQDQTALKLAAKKAWARLCVFGTIKKIGKLLEIKISMINVDNDQKVQLVDIKDETEDVFNLERKISWELSSSVQGNQPTNHQDEEVQKKIEDLPI